MAVPPSEQDPRSGNVPAAASDYASWNPAFRPNTSDDLRESLKANDGNNRHDTFATSLRESEPTQSARDAMSETVLNRPKSGQSNTMSYGDTVQEEVVNNMDDDGPVLQSSQTYEEQEQRLDAIVVGTNSNTSPVAYEQDTSFVDDGAIQRPPGSYEHQGSIAPIELAIDENPAASLLADEESMPTPGIVSREPTFDQVLYVPVDQTRLSSDHSSAVTEKAPILLDRSFTNNFTEDHEQPQDANIEEPSSNHVEQAQDWPAFGDDHTFADLLSHDDPAPIQAQSKPSLHGNTLSQDWSIAGDESSFEELIGISQISAAAQTQSGGHGIDLNDAPTPASDTGSFPAENAGKDLAAAFQAALDDDDLLEDQDEIDPSSFFEGGHGFLDDDDGLLDDDLLVDTLDAVATSAPLDNNKLGGSRPPPNVYQNALPSAMSDANRPSIISAQSFADKAKGGYQSPYDLPMDVVKSRRRPQALQSGQASSPPPRTSSFPVQPSQQSPHMANASRAISASMSPTLSQLQATNLAPSNSASPSSLTDNVSKSAHATQKPAFFEDLPIKQKPRSRLSSAFVPTATGPSMQSPALSTPYAAGPPPIARSPSRTQIQASPQSTPVSNGAVVGAGAIGLGLRQPERMPLYPESSTSEEPNPSVTSSAVPSAIASRYSPAPGAQNTMSRPRYGPTPVSSHAFAPRTSSPLAQHADLKSIRSNSDMDVSGLIQEDRKTPERRAAPNSRYSYNPAASTNLPNMTGTSQVTPPFSTPALANVSSERPTRSSMGSQMNGQETPARRGPVLPHRRQYSKDLGFVAPRDSRAQDPLERWKGGPLFCWSSSGSTVYSLPNQTPVYAAGQGGPSLKCTAGNVTIQDASSLLPLSEQDIKFPGPLAAKAKGKKKDIISWLSSKIQTLEQEAEASRQDYSVSSELKQRSEEKLILWKTVKIFVENDGKLELEGKPAEEMRSMLLPNLSQMNTVVDLQTPHPVSETIDKAALFHVRQALFEGRREQAILLAEEQKLWGHAMLIASTMGPSAWKQIVQAFVRSEVKSVGSDARSLAALYQVFGGNNEDCVDELVPPSARAGFKMVSKDSGVVANNPLEGLDQWRETLSLIIGNRTGGEGPSLVSLGKLLADYGRAEAGHTCLLFGRNFAKHSGADDPEANFVLLGSSASTNSDANFGSDLDSILLTEVYEWATSLSGVPTATPYAPHLQAYKLMHAHALASHGYRQKAQSYCEHITQVYTSTPKPSPYYHPTFTQAVADLAASLSHTSDDKGGFFKKPTMTKVSSGAASWFTKFVSGDEDREIDDGAAAQTGPFGGVESPPISHSNSETQIYSPMSGHVAIASQDAQSTYTSAQQSYGVASRYAPSTSVPTENTYSSGLNQHVVSSRYTPQPTGTSLTPGSSPGKPNRFPSEDDMYASPQRAFNGPVQSIPDGSPAKKLVSPPSRPSSTSTRYAPSMTPLNNNRTSLEDTLAGSSSRRQSSQLMPASESMYTPFTQSNSFDPARDSLVYEDPQTSHAQAQPSSAPEYGHGLDEPGQQQGREFEDGMSDNDGYDRTRNFGNDESNDLYTSSNGGYEPYGGDVPYGTSSHFAPTRFTASGANPASLDTSPKLSDSRDESADQSYQPFTGGYEPPTSGYQPYVPDDEPTDDDEGTKSKAKKSFMDEDDDDQELIRRAEALKKTQADREADDAFRKAAEADMARDNARGGADKKGWFGGWFGKKDPNAMPGPSKAKLGEQNSFVYDEELKRWVSKTSGSESATPVAATPPPPRGPPARTSVMGPPSGPPSRVASAAGLPPSMVPMRQVSTPAPTPSGPPSRAGTPAAELSGADPNETNGPASGQPLQPPSRPSTNVNNANTLDDLLGGPPGAGRRGGTVKGKKKGGRYVDVMAK